MIEEFITILNQNSGALTVIFTGVVSLSTVVYAILTFGLVSETRKLREVQTEPQIEITLRPFEFAINILRLHVKNIGSGPAKKVRFECNVISGGEAGENLLSEFTQTNFFKTGLTYLSPNQEFHSNYTQLTQNFEQKMECVLLFKISYKSVTGKQYENKAVIDMSEFKDMYQLGISKPLFDS